MISESFPDHKGKQEQDVYQCGLHPIVDALTEEINNIVQQKIYSQEMTVQPGLISCEHYEEMDYIYIIYNIYDKIC